MSNPRDLLAGGGDRPIILGNVYIVAQRAESWYNDFEENFGGVYNDGSQVLYGVASGANANIAIQAALDACVADRGDYVVIMPAAADYDIYAALTIDAKGTHLVCPSGVMDGVAGSTNAARIHQNTAATACMTLSAAAVEIAGFFFKNYAALQAITLTAGSAYSMNIHHNSFGWNVTGSTNAASIVGTGDGGAWGMIHHNNFFSYSGGSATQAVGAVNIAAPATFARVCYNDATVGEVNTVTTVFNNLAVKGHTDFNNIMATSDATMTDAITVNALGCAMGNLIAAPSQASVTGGTVDRSFVQNFTATDGGLVNDSDT